MNLLACLDRTVLEVLYVPEYNLRFFLIHHQKKLGIHYNHTHRLFCVGISLKAEVSKRVSLYVWGLLYIGICIGGSNIA